jgi:lipopolysaccharide biosynthesis glycosyltransferase
MKIKILFLLCLVLFCILLKKKRRENFNNQEQINIVLSCDKNQFVGLVAILNSILIHTKQKNRLFFNFLVDKNEKDILDKLLKRKLNLKNYYIKEIEEDKMITENIRVNRDNNIKNIMNFARFNFENEFSHLDKILYLDCDMIVKAPIENLYDKFDNINYPIASVKIKNFKNSEDIYSECKKMYNLKEEYPYFNAGVYCTSLNYWRQNGIKKKIIQIMKAHKKSKKGLFKLGTQPILNIAFANNFQVLEKAWNTAGLGYKKVSQQVINNAKILHWTGKQKPWLPNGRYKEIWNKYKL